MQWRESTSLLFQMLCSGFAYKRVFALSDTLAANTFPVMIKPGKWGYKEIIASGPKLFYMCWVNKGTVANSVTHPSGPLIL